MYSVIYLFFYLFILIDGDVKFSFLISKNSSDNYDKCLICVATAQYSEIHFTHARNISYNQREAL